MKKGKIIISGGGDLDVSSVIDKRFFSLLGQNSKILYIPIALNRSTLGYESCYDWFSTVISKHVGRKEIDYTMLLEGDVVPDLQLFNSIYIGGGNTFKLLDYVIRSGLDNKLLTYLKKGGIVYGGSAGAIILGKDIRTVKEENNNNYSHHKGLDLLGGRSLICHYNKGLDVDISESSKNLKTEILALSEESGIVLNLDGNINEKVGTVTVFNGENKYLL